MVTTRMQNKHEIIMPEVEVTDKMKKIMKNRKKNIRRNMGRENRLLMEELRRVKDELKRLNSTIKLNQKANAMEFMALWSNISDNFQNLESIFNFKDRVENKNNSWFVW